jgi:3-methyladenine DNA glycosylase/8-oxoguanine DNA glycosylase
VSDIAAPPGSGRATPDWPERTVALPHPGSLRTTLAPFRYGNGDPTTTLSATDFWRATRTPDGDATVHLRMMSQPVKNDRAGLTSRPRHVVVRAWGAGGQWMLDRAPALLGEADPGHVFDDAHPAILHAQRNHPNVRFGASHDLFHELIPAILGQRITGGEALRQWATLVRRLGEPAPGPMPRLMLPPTAQRLATQPVWWFHPLGIEAKRAAAIIASARHASKMWDWADGGSTLAAARLQLIRGVGVWTVANAVGIGLGDPDAVEVGDFHVKHIVCFALDGTPRGTDERMLELLAPYAGQRNRVVKLLLADGHRERAFGPRQRILPMASW